MNRHPPPLPLRLLAIAVSTVPRPHLHWFRWAGHDPYGNGSRYECRCGAVRPGL